MQMYTTKNISEKKEFLIIFHGRYNEKKRLVALKRAQAHSEARASPELLYHLIFRYCCCCWCYCCCYLCPMPFLSLCISTYASHTRARAHKDFCMYPFCLFICVCERAWEHFFLFLHTLTIFPLRLLVCIRVQRSLFYFIELFLLFCITTTIISVAFLFHVRTQMLLSIIFILVVFFPSNEVADIFLCNAKAQWDFFCI